MKRLKTQGLTIVELLVVISIIGILASVVMARLSDARDRAQVIATIAELASIRTAIQMHYDDTGIYPNGANSFCRTDPGIANEVNLNEAAGSLTANGNSVANWNGPYLQDALDVWGNPYFLDEDYQCLAETEGCNGIADTDSDTGSSVIVSCGPNGALAGGACAYDEDNIVYYLCDT